MKKLIKSALLALFIFCIFGVNSLAEEDHEFDISASEYDEVVATLTEKDGKYELFISGVGSMTEFSDTDDLPWREYAERVDSVIVGEGVENVPFAIFKYASRLEVRNISATIDITYEYDIEYYGHAISTMATVARDCSIDAFYFICDFHDARCTECGYECTSHGGGAPTCTEYALCSICSYPYERYLGHDMAAQVPEKPATCTIDGMLAYSTCNRCKLCFLGDGSVASPEELVIKAGHRFGELIEAESPTCDKLGVISYSVCSECGLKRDENGDEIDSTVIPMLAHTFDDPPSCKSSAICTECKKTVSDKDNHELVSYVYDKSGHSQKCACGELVTALETHSLSSNIIKEATEEEEGEILYSCKCGYSDTVKIPRLEADDPPANDTPTEDVPPADDEPNDDGENSETEEDESRVGLVLIISASIIVGLSLVSLLIVLIIRKRK